MPNEVKEKFSAAAALTISLASLASSSVGVGRQSTVVDNSTSRYGRILLYVKVKQGTSPTSARGVYVWGIRSDGAGSPQRTDGAGASDAAFTAVAAQLLGILPNKATGAATGDNVIGEVIFDNPGPGWAIAISHDTGVALDSTGGNHVVNWVGVNPEIQ
jgi:hypothetical protein